jgi:hypothetical protein
MTAYETDIYYAIKSPNLDSVIQNFLERNNIQLTVEQWRLMNYEKLRKWDYPKVEELADAQAKINSTDPVLIAEGHLQLSEYYAKCIEVKKRFPKVETEIQDLDKLKTLKKNIVNAARVKKVSSGFDVEGVWFAFDNAARIAYLELFLALSVDNTMTQRWRADTEWVNMNYTLFQKLIIAGRVHLSTHFNWQESKETEIDSCTTIEQLNEVIIE